MRGFKRYALAMAALIMPSQVQAACGTRAYESRSYYTCTYDPARVAIALHYKNGQGQTYNTLGSFVRQQEATGAKILFAMNAGMYHPDRKPVGFYAENGVVETPVNTRSGRGNFFMKPNGIFALKQGKASILPTDRFPIKVHPDYATQSGPMLVINGKIHPQFIEDSTSRKIRNGIGVRKDGHVVMAVSLDRVNFHEFARLFQKELHAPNALYLDGTVSSFYAPDYGMSAGYMPLGPILSVQEK